MLTISTQKYLTFVMPLYFLAAGVGMYGITSWTTKGNQKLRLKVAIAVCVAFVIIFCACGLIWG